MVVGDFHRFVLIALNRPNRNLRIVLIPPVISAFRPFLVCLAAILLCLPPRAGRAGEREAWRAYAGLTLFPSVLAADRDIAEKRTPAGRLRLLIVFREHRGRAEELADRLRSATAIAGIPLQVGVRQAAGRFQPTSDPVAGIYLAEPLGRAREAVLRYGRQHHTIVFSPFEGDVAAGVPTGLIISDRIMPYVNPEALSDFSIRLKPFFLRVAARYE
jgi:hypothetical protein